jgi:hypothetical protein
MSNSEAYGVTIIVFIETFLLFVTANALDFVHPTVYRDKFLYNPFSHILSTIHQIQQQTN